MGRALRDEYARRPDETNLEWTMRRARMKADARDRSEPIVTPEAQRHGRYEEGFVTHVETGTKAHTVRNRISNLVDRWLDEGEPHFPPGARVAIEHCQRLWNVCPIIGKQIQTYAPPTPAGAVSHEELYRLDARRELEIYENWFPRPYWEVFERIVRDGQSAGAAAAGLDASQSSRIAMAKPIVGMIACHIAARNGW